MVQILRSLGDRSLRQLVDLERGLINREVYVNPDIYQQELEQVFSPRLAVCRTRVVSAQPRRLLSIAHGGGSGDPGAGPQEQAPRVPEHMSSPGNESVPVRRRERPAVHVSLSRVELRHRRPARRRAALQGGVPGRVGQERLRATRGGAIVQLLRLYLGHVGS